MTSKYGSAMKSLGVCLVALLLTGCGLSELERAGHRAVYEAVKPEYVEYIRADEGLTLVQKARREEQIRQWGRLVGVVK